MKKFLIGLSRWLLKVVTITTLIILLIESWMLRPDVIKAILIILGVAIVCGIVFGTILWIVISWSLSEVNTYEDDN